MNKQNIKLAIRHLVDGYYINKRYSTTIYCLLWLLSIGIGLLSLYSAFGYFNNNNSMVGFGEVTTSQVLLFIPSNKLFEWSMYALPGISFSFFLVMILPKSNILVSNVITFLFLVFMYCTALCFGHFICFPNAITGGIFAGCIGLMKETKSNKILPVSLGLVGLIAGLLGTILVFSLPEVGSHQIPYFYAYLPWQLAIGLFLIFNYEERDHKIIQIP